MCFVTRKSRKLTFDAIVLVGSSALIPEAQQLLTDFLHGRGLCKSTNQVKPLATRPPCRLLLLLVKLLRKHKICYRWFSPFFPFVLKRPTERRLFWLRGTQLSPLRSSKFFNPTQTIRPVYSFRCLQRDVPVHEITAFSANSDSPIPRLRHVKLLRSRQPLILMQWRLKSKC